MHVALSLAAVEPSQLGQISKVREPFDLEWPILTAKEWNQTNQTGKRRAHPPGGFCALSRRSGRKPVIAAVNGICYGGGCEAIINCDMVIAAKRATFALPEVKIGVAAQAGALPRLSAGMWCGVLWCGVTICNGLELTHHIHID